MRTIKFAAIYKPTGLHVEVVELNFNDNTLTYRDEKGDCDWCHFSLDGKYGDVILRQFTGLHDKNGKEIYEGDVLKGHYWNYGKERRFIGKVVYGMHGFKLVGVKQYLGMSQDFCSLYEIIGNIYENPQLVEQTT